MTDKPTSPADIFADSTVAMTIYNLLCINNRPLTIEQLTEQAAMVQHVGLGKAQTQRAADGLVTRGRLRQDDGAYALIAKERLPVVKRDLSDYVFKTMDGGWDGWHVKDPRIRDGQGGRPLEQLLGQPATGRKERPLPMRVTK